ncbi:MAG: PcfK-like family protein [Prevotella sp.]|nr:PcfK-like family protein [Prevotella sp.]
MKSTEEFKRTIQTYLERYANEDTLFARNYHKENKNIDDCITYILNYVQNSGCNGFTDEEIYGQAVHYYDEDEIDAGTPVNCRIVVNHTVELTEEEKAETHQRAIRQYQYAELQKLQSRNKPRANKTQITEPSLFDF